MALGTNISGKLTAVVTRQSDAGGTASAIGEPMHEAIPQAQSPELLADHSLEQWRSTRLADGNILWRHGVSERFFWEKMGAAQIMCMRSRQKYTELESATQEMHTQTLHISLLVGK